MTNQKKPRRKDPYETPDGNAGIFRQLFRYTLFFLTITALLTALLILWGWWQIGGSLNNIHVEGGDPNLNPVEQLYLQTYLASNASALQQSAGKNDTPQQFTITQGATAAQIAQNLATANLINDPELFVNYVRFYGLDSQLEAGTFTLSAQSTPVEIAIALTDAKKQEESIRFVEGWRLEEMGDYLRQNQPAQVDPEQFLLIAGRKQAFDLSPYPFLATLPSNASLEGYLFPDTYRLEQTATATDLIHKMLLNFDARVTPEIRQQIGQQGLTLREAVALASIVEREAVVEAERPQIARVFLNRLEQGIKLDADPTIQYALGQQSDGNWWKSPLWLVDLELDSPYNSYLYKGLPPSPIANPGLASIQAVSAPANSSYLFFVADCNPEAPGSHLFSLTYEEHVANVAKCN